ncbi:transporter substrate-binding domain-containing protein [Fusibacter paucivorans]|uniref:Transporter substrate-binding domain-containing protein n=1 Tax=Fusibacter paucivorans TaxID=76009 RepID=A0ABS5PVB6_9FIRM|nr:transporter substrate-binding domain-containing protein [Fusibacter paucivorans]MBS7528062.1 transporter substrate-binding domain-containing protein [Fusibacter paucivorans]
MKNKSLKRLLGVTLAMAMILAAFTGCGSKAAEAPAADSNNAAASSTATAEPANLLEKIQADGKLQVICEPYFAPYEFIDSSLSGQEQYKGADMELARYIANDLGVELEIIPLEWTAVLTGISTGKYQMAISGMGYTEERAEAMTLSDSYNDIESFHGFVIKKENLETFPTLESLYGKRIAFQKGSLQEMYTNAQIQDVQGQPFDSVQNAILALQSGKVDAVAVSYDNGELFVDANEDLAMAEPLFEDTKDKTVVAVPKGETELITEINRIIADVRSQGLYVKWWDEATEQAKALDE